MVLPFGNKITEKIELGCADSAPTKPRLAIKFLVTTIISIILTMITAHLIENDYLEKLAVLYEEYLVK
jgi:predicted secreted protein